LTPADAVVVWGAGTIGLLTIRAARLAGAGSILAVVKHPLRFSAALAMGADTVVDARDDDALSTILDALRDAPRVVAFDAVGSVATRQAAVSVVGPAGTVVLLGLRETETCFDASKLIRSEIALLGSYAYTAADLRQAITHLGDGAVVPDGWLEERPLEAGPAAFAELIDAPGTAVKIMLAPGDGAR
jgi:threonine dehydrogenase-like Zn-dependent dehydrogenase